ncbi:MAG TPA: phosphate signaling complex protein PhoU [Pseudomonadales bacterium]|nr:phosphate signaling complex protein PhoU [Pseudomonadales bacterium]
MREHISGQYDAELDAVRNHVMEMGGVVELLLREACDALLLYDAELAESAIARDREVNLLEVQIDDECNHIIARRQPTASDLRLVMSIVKTITDLERVGDEASRIAKMAIQIIGMDREREPAPELRTMVRGVREMLRSALDAFARVDLTAAVDVIARDKDIDRAWDALVARIVPAMEADPSQVRRGMNLIWCGRSLERIGDHAKNVSEYVVYLGKGQDVRHLPLERKRQEAGRD